MPDSGSPALLSGATTFAYATTRGLGPCPAAGCPSSGSASSSSITHWSGAGHWSGPARVRRRSVLDTTGPAGAVDYQWRRRQHTRSATVSVDGPGVRRGRGHAASACPTVPARRRYRRPGHGQLAPSVCRGRRAWTLAPGDGAQDGLRPVAGLPWATWSGGDPRATPITLDLGGHRTFTAISRRVRLARLARHANPAGITVFRHGIPQTFQITGRGGIPANAVAVTGNLSVTAQPGRIRHPRPIDRRPTTSTINFPVNDIAPTASSSRSTAAASSRRSTRSAGKKVQSCSTSRATSSSVRRHRVLLGLPDPRPRHPHQQPGGGAHPQPERSVRVQGGRPHRRRDRHPGRCRGDHRQPDGRRPRRRAGYLSLTPTSQANPATSTLNFPVGDVRANNVTVKLGAGGNLYVVYKGSGKAHAHPRRDRLLPQRRRLRPGRSSPLTPTRIGRHPE